MKLLLDKVILIITMFIWSIPLFAQDSIPASFFRKIYHQGNMVHYFEGLNDNIVYEGNHSGSWSDADQLIFSINGNPYYMNSYYIDDFRIDNRLEPGSTLYTPNLEHYNTNIGTNDASIHFYRDIVDAEFIEMSANHGNIGGITKGTSEIIHIFHRAGWEGAYKPNVSINNRQHIKNAYSLETAFNPNKKNIVGNQIHIYTQFGNRMLPKYDCNGLIDDEPLFNSCYYKFQTDGKITIKNSFFDYLGFLGNISQKDDYGSEFYFNWDEQAISKFHSISAYGIRDRGKHKVVAGITYSLNKITHHNISFARNVVDQDGESFEPWYPDGNHHELSLYAGYNKKISPNIETDIKAYNTIYAFQCKSKAFENELYYQPPTPSAAHITDVEDINPLNYSPLPLYRYEWESSSFTSALLENSLGVKVNKALSKSIMLFADVYLTVDGFVLSNDKSKISTNIKSKFQLNISPFKWCDVTLRLSHDRIPYNIYHIKYFSNEYLNGRVFYSGTNTLFSTTGGKYRNNVKKLRQTGYYSIDIPIKLYLDNKRRHQITFLQTYRKYYNVWVTNFDKDNKYYGYYNNEGVFFQYPCEKKYSVTYLPKNIMGKNFLYNTPYYLSQLTRYTYSGKKTYFSISWQSMQFASISALGNGPNSNNINILSESTANPNTNKVIENPNSINSPIGRSDQDKAYICRIFWSHNLSKSFQFGLLAKWTDGQPFSDFKTFIDTDKNDCNQIAIIPGRSRGTNPIDKNFGSRENAIFNIDAHFKLVWRFRGHNMFVTMKWYNLVDFGNSINEYCFNTGLGDDRADMALNIPRGLIMTYNIDL